MVASFFSMEAHVATIPLVERRTVNAEWYAGVCLPQVFQEGSEKHPRSGLRGLLLHHDNASANTSAVTGYSDREWSAVGVPPALLA